MPYWLQSTKIITKQKVENKKDRNMLKLVVCLKLDKISIIFDVNLSISLNIFEKIMYPEHNFITFLVFTIENYLDVCIIFALLFF